MVGNFLLSVKIPEIETKLYHLCTVDSTILILIFVAKFNWYSYRYEYLPLKLIDVLDQENNSFSYCLASNVGGVLTICQCLTTVCVFLTSYYFSEVFNILSTFKFLPEMMLLFFVFLNFNTIYDELTKNVDFIVFPIYFALHGRLDISHKNEYKNIQLGSNNIRSFALST